MKLYRDLMYLSSQYRFLIASIQKEIWTYNGFFSYDLSVMNDLDRVGVVNIRGVAELMYSDM